LGAARRQKISRQRTTLAAAFWREQLSDEFTPISDIEMKASKLGISRVALGRAATMLDVKVKRVTRGGSSKLCWRLPPEPAANGAQPTH
jgi:hypothetical protein